MEMSERLRKAREGRGITQADAAAKAGIAKGTLSYLESGITTQPNVETLLALAKVYGKSVEYLVMGKEN